MRKLRMFTMISLDGFFAGPDGNIDWHTVDDEFNEFAIKLLGQVDTILFGRTTYQLFEEYWPKALTDPKTGHEDRIIAKAIDENRKIVVSRSLKDVSWHGSELWHDLDMNALKNLKQQPGKDIIIYGSGSIIQQLVPTGLIDEYNLMVAPVAIGRGRCLFEDVPQTSFKLVGTRTFGNGNVLLSYS